MGNMCTNCLSDTRFHGNADVYLESRKTPSPVRKTKKVPSAEEEDNLLHFEGKRKSEVEKLT